MSNGLLLVDVCVAAHFVNWPPQPAKSHAVMVDGDGNSYLTGSDGVNVSRSGGTSNNNIGSHGGNDLASILARLSEREQSHLARLVIVHMIEPANKGGMTASYRYPSPTLSPSFPLRVLHGQQLDGHRMKRSQAGTDQDEMIWEMLRDWIAQEQRMMAADQPPTELQQDPAAAAGQKELAVDDDPFESSGDDKETAFVQTKGKSVGGDGRRVVLTQPDQKADLVVERDDDLLPASQMAIAESLILLPSPTPGRLEKKNESDLGQQQNEERLKTTTLAPLRPSITSRSDPSVNQTGSDHLLLVHDHIDQDETGPEFVYEDHVIEIVQLDPLASVTPQPSPLLVAHHPATTAASPSMNKTGSNPVEDVIVDISSHPSSGQTLLETLSSTDETVTIQPQNDLFVESNGPVHESPSRLNLSDPGRLSDDWPEPIQSLARLANVSDSVLPLANITNDTLPPDWDEMEASFNGTWPLIVPLVGPRIDSDSAKVLVSLAGNISEELLPQWRDVISYRGPVQSLPPIGQSDCHCPCLDASPLTTDPVPTTETIPQSTLDPIPFNCPLLDISTTSTTTTTTTMPTTTTEATTTTQMIPPILILEGEGRRIC